MSQEPESKRADRDPVPDRSDEGSERPMQLKQFTHQGWRWRALLQVVRDRPHEVPLEMVFVGEEVDGGEKARYGLPLDQEVVDLLSDSLGRPETGLMRDLLQRAWEEGRKLDENGSGTSL